MEIAIPLATYREHQAAVRGICWSPDSTRIASASKDTSVRIWEATTGHDIRTYRGHNADVFSVAWAPDGAHVASGGMDETVQVWEAATGLPRIAYEDPSRGAWVQAIAWSRGGDRLAAATLQGVYAWTLTDQHPLSFYPAGLSSACVVAWSPDGRALVMGGIGLALDVRDSATGRVLLSYGGHTDFVTKVAWSPLGEYIASGSSDRTVHVWKAATGEPVVIYHGHPAMVFDVSWSPSGSHIASASGKDSSGLTVPEGVTVGSEDNSVQVWDAMTAQLKYTYLGHSNVVSAVSWSPDGTLAASGSWDKTVQVWSPRVQG